MAKPTTFAKPKPAKNSPVSFNFGFNVQPAKPKSPGTNKGKPNRFAAGGGS